MSTTLGREKEALIAKHMAMVIRARREEKHLSLEELARRSKVASSSIQRMEKGDRLVRLDLVALVCIGLEMELNDLIEEVLRRAGLREASRKAG
jgi:transcriptional regulator with XRE-family HTH domain